MDWFPILCANQNMISIFVKVDDLQAVDPWVVWFFFNHYVDNFLPPRETVGVPDTIIEESLMDIPD
jgi:hypothetical protein